jgi:hypothetical protein
VEYYLAIILRQSVHLSTTTFLHTGTNLSDLSRIDTGRHGSAASPPKYDGTLGQAKSFLTYYNSVLVPHIQAHHPYIAVWELYKPLPRVLGKSVAIPSDIAELCRPENIASTLRNLSSGPRTPYEGRPDSTPQAGYGGLSSVAAVRQDLRNAQWDMWTVRTAYQGLAQEVKTDPQFRERLSIASGSDCPEPAVHTQDMQTQASSPVSVQQESSQRPAGVHPESSFKLLGGCRCALFDMKAEKLWPLQRFIFVD